MGYLERGENQMAKALVWCLGFQIRRLVGNSQRNSTSLSFCPLNGKPWVMVCIITNFGMFKSIARNIWQYYMIFQQGECVVNRVYRLTGVYFFFFSDIKLGSMESHYPLGGSDIIDMEVVPRWQGPSSVIQSYQTYLSGQSSLNLTYLSEHSSVL